MGKVLAISNEDILKRKLDESYETLIKSQYINKEQQSSNDKSATAKVTSGSSRAVSKGATVTNANATVSDTITPKGTNYRLTEAGKKKLLSAINSVIYRNAVNSGMTNSEAINAVRGYGSQSITSSDITGEYIKIETNSDTESTPTAVSSDPIKPEDVSITLTAEDVYDGTTNMAKEYTFNLKQLYEGTVLVDLNSNTYTDKNSGKKVSAKDVIATTKDGIITQTQTSNYNELSSYRFLINDYLKQDTIVNENEYNTITKENFSDKFFGNDKFHHIDVKGDVPTKKLVRYRYVYGFDGIVAAQKAIEDSCGYISSDIDVSDCDYIELAATIFDDVEYSIIDGKEEVPFLPINQDSIVGERLFFGIMPRFDIMNPSEIVVKRDGETIGISSLQDLQLFLLTNNTDSEVGQSSFLREGKYTIDYVPGASSKKYYPNNKTVRIKVIQRNMSGKAPFSIDSLVIRKYGQHNPWALSTYDNDVDYNSGDPRT